jgi:hypothetical protein
MVFSWDFNGIFMGLMEWNGIIIIIIDIYISIYLVGGFNHLEKYESQWEGLSHVLWKVNENKTCSKPPTSFNSRPFRCRYTMIYVVIHCFGW